MGHFIGTAPNRQVFYLEAASAPHSDNIRYIAKDIEMFIQELNSYKQYSENYYLKENPSDETLEKYADGFKELVMTIDPNAFCDPESYWSVIVEQMEYTKKRFHGHLANTCAHEKNSGKEKTRLLQLC